MTRLFSLTAISATLALLVASGFAGPRDTPENTTGGLHVMVFSADLDEPRLDRLEFVFAPDLPAKIGYLLAPESRNNGLRLPGLENLRSLTLLDIFMFYPEKAELREDKRKARKHENPIAGLTLNLLARTWAESGYSLEVSGSYLSKFQGLGVTGKWDETRIILQRGSGQLLLFAFTGVRAAHEAVFGKPSEEEASSYPKLLTQTTPEYPTPLVDSKWTGIVKFTMLIDTEGRVDPHKVILLECPHVLFAISSLEQILKHWRFEPGRLQGEPVSMMAGIEVSFQLHRR